MSSCRMQRSLPQMRLRPASQQSPMPRMRNTHSGSDGKRREGMTAYAWRGDRHHDCSQACCQAARAVIVPCAQCGKPVSRADRKMGQGQNSWACRHCSAGGRLIAYRHASTTPAYSGGNAFPRHQPWHPEKGPLHIVYDEWPLFRADFSESDEADCLWTWDRLCLLDSGVVQELMEMGMRGIITHEVHSVEDRPHSRQYMLIRPGGWGGMASRDSGVRLAKFHECCGHRHYSPVKDWEKLIDPAQWDGSDVFMVWPMPRFIFMSPRMKDALSSMRLTGFEILPVEECRFGHSGFSPGILSHYMPAEQACRIGEPLGIE